MKRLDEIVAGFVWYEAKKLEGQYKTTLSIFIAGFGTNLDGNNIRIRHDKSGYCHAIRYRFFPAMDFNNGRKVPIAIRAKFPILRREY